MQLSPDQITQFQEKVWAYYRTNKREMPWRTHPTAYFVVVSEVMLQQTQVSRVTVKFAEFTKVFPDFNALAAASLGDVLRVWSGLGYNRRAKFIWQTAKEIVSAYGGELPQSVEELQRLPGIGPNTAGAIVAYTFNLPTVFIETNIRTVFIHHFFADAQEVSDRDLKQLAAQTLPVKKAREWYWALMDYGTYLKTTSGAYLQRSKHYRKQSRFKGSRRQIRGEVLRHLLVAHPTSTQLASLITDERLPEVLLALVREGLIEERSTGLYLTDG